MRKPSAKHPSVTAFAGTDIRWPITLLALALMIEPRDAADVADVIDAAEPMDSADTADPIEPIDSTEPIEPIESNDPRHPMHSTEPSDHSDHFEFAPTGNIYHRSAPSRPTGHAIPGRSNGFLLLAERYSPTVVNTSGRVDTAVFRSTDARNWTPVSTPPGLNVEGIDGDRIVGVDAAGVVQTSADGGTTRNATDVGALLPAGTPQTAPWIADAGPLGFAVVVSSDMNPTDQQHGHDYLLFSSDGISWSTTDLAAAGAPADATPIQVTVGADHLGVDHQSPQTTPGGPMKITTLLATPKR
jgi:hypothetical protein